MFYTNFIYVYLYIAHWFLFYTFTCKYLKYLKKYRKYTLWIHIYIYIYIYIGLLLASCSWGFAKSYRAFLAQCDAGYQQEPTGVDLHIVPRGNGGSNPLLQLPRIAMFDSLLIQDIFPCHCHASSLIYFSSSCPIHFLLLCTVHY